MVVFRYFQATSGSVLRASPHADPEIFLVRIKGSAVLKRLQPLLMLPLTLLFGCRNARLVATHDLYLH